MTTNTPTDEIVFSTIPSLTTCSQVTVGWTYRRTTFPTPNYALVVAGRGTVQGNHDRREYPFVSRQSTTITNMTLAMINPSLGRFDWPKVNIPQGRYHLDVYTPTGVLSSNIFAVNNGVDVSCLVAQSQSSIPPSATLPVAPSSIPSPTLSTPPSPATTPSTSNPSATSLTPVVGASSVNKGAIAGVVVAAVAILVLIAAVALWAFRRRRARARNAILPGSVPRTKGHHSPSESTGEILPYGSGNRENSPQPSTSEEDFASEKSTIAHDDPRPNPTPIAATRSFWRSSTSNRRPTSMTVKPSFESSETVQSRSSRQLHRSLDSTVAPPSMTVIPPRPPSPSLPRRLSDRTRRTSRKPVPVYDPGEFPGSGADDIPLPRLSGTSLGGGTETYYLIPDPPLEQRK